MHESGRFAIHRNDAPVATFIPIVAQKLGRVLSPPRAIPARERVFRAILVASPADTFRMLWIQRKDLCHDVQYLRGFTNPITEHFTQPCRDCFDRNQIDMYPEANGFPASSCLAGTRLFQGKTSKRKARLQDGLRAGVSGKGGILGK